MGRRKERRLAAISAAGRRVKLDLFAEPLGDLGCSSAQDEVGVDGDSRTHAKLPNSPSSSGQQLQNPLMLLEQYSDDELDECLGELHNDADAEDPSGDLDNQTKIAGGITTKDMETDDVNAPSIQTVEQLEMDDVSSSHDPLQKLGKECITLNDTNNLLIETKPMEEATSPAASVQQEVGDVSLSWKKVLHEESNHYYYWNIITGETSWEVPDVLAQATDVNCLEKTVGDTSTTTLDIEQDDANTRKLNGGSEANCITDQGAETDGFDEGCKGDSLDNERGNTDANENRQTSLFGDALVVNGTDLSSQAVKHCESLLERLNTLKSLNCNLQWQEFKLKTTSEVEIRLSDIKALASHGSSLLPFWLHTEGQLKRLDTAIDDAIQHFDSAPTSEYEAAAKSQEGIEIDSNEKKTPRPAVEFHAPDYAAEKSQFDTYSDVATTTGYVPSVGYPTTFSKNDTEGKTEIIELEMQSELLSKPVYQSGEEVDMDVDMEVEDTSTLMKSSIGDASGTLYHVLSEQSNLHNPHADQEHTVLGQIFNVQPPLESWIPPPPLDNEPFPPPPPDNEPFPPPPPDDEPFPPPPPDEPPDTSYPPPSHLESVHSFPYSEQYILSYPSSNPEYYGQSSTEVSGTTLYAHPEGVQVAVSHIPHFYEAVSNVYAIAPLVVNPVEPSSYYGLQNGNLNPISLVSGAAVESSGIQSESVLENGDTDMVQSLVPNAEAGSNLLPKTNLNVVKSGQVTVKEPEVSDAQPSIKAQSTASVTHNVAASSTSDVTTSVATAATSKVQSKVSRSKKRTVAVVSAMRSNKKVSSLVDKWKAAKEELHEEEEEPESTYEMLEKKRQREIEEWQAQQIASGEAKDNANFQPLGGDWRERVKRKRALKMKETEKKAPEPTGHEKADLVELSRGLPSGWQVYWDESSKQVYYGNVVTSETTWIRPKD